jgi:SAM-dependent methyltransferase
MVRSRAVSAPEPGQDREVAALRDTACAPRGSRIGVQDWRARPGLLHDNGCTVRFRFSLRASVRTTQDVLDAGEAIGLPDPAASPPLDVPGWPGAHKRGPGIANPVRLVLRPLSQAIARAVVRDVAPGGQHQAVLDVGCGQKPYLPYFAAVADEYVGADLHPAPHVDVVCPSHALPFPDARFDVVLSTQALEHVPEPAATVAEMHRVLKPGGVLLVSVPLTAAYHPGPTDFWRWTQEGLIKMHRDNGDWAELRLEAAGGTMACLGYLVGFYAGAMDIARPLRATLVSAVNVVFGALDRLVPLRYPRPYALTSSLLAVARKA